jgi:AmmeMemoRadiSam system protein A
MPSAEQQPPPDDAGQRSDGPAAPDAELAPEHRRRLLTLARGSIRHGLDTGRPLVPDPADQPPALLVPRAAFVTLELGGRLRGCIGHLEATQALALDVSDNAFAAAFQDPRFPPLTERELAPLGIKISVLTPATELSFADETELLATIEPGIDGLILTDRGRRGTFLPAVWEQLPEPLDFLRRLKEKAGLPPDHWTDSLRVWRYRTESFGE